MTRTPAEPLADGEMIEKVARADLRRAGYAHALLKMRDMLIAVHDELEDEGDRVYLGSSNHAELIHDAWHLADALHWDEILEDSQPKTPLAEVNLLLQDQLKEARAAIAAYNPNDRLREALEPNVRRRLESVAMTLETCGKHGLPIDFAMLASDIRAALSHKD